MSESRRKSAKRGRRPESTKAGETARGSRESQPPRPWHPCDDGIDPIADALEEIVNASDVDLPDRIKARSTSPSGRLGDAIRGPRISGQSVSGRMELTRRWLQFNHHRDDAEEFATRLDALMDRLRSWEGAARDDRPLSGPLFNEDVYSEWLRLTEEAVETADFLRQLSAMVRSELSRRSHATLAAQDASVSVTIADPLDEIPILPPTEEKRRAEGWILASEAAKICDVTLRYLRQERSDGFKGGEPSRGKDKRGRIWAAEGGKSKDVWYKRNSLKPRAKRKKKPTE